MPCLRRLSIKYPPRLKVLNAAKTTYFITAKNGNPVKRVSFKCQLCGTAGLKQKEVAVDHVIPVVDLEGWTNWEDFINRLYCEQDNLQLICNVCHDKKSATENSERYLFDKKSKQ